MTRILLLGGTTEASLMARALAEAGKDAVFSYAGRTNDPVPQPLPQRVGGFGGVAGLVYYLQAESITHIIDATHPFAAQMSHHAHAAALQTGVPLAALQRPAWSPEPGDHWTRVGTLAEAAGALPTDPTHVFLAIGRQNLDLFATAPQHHYLLRLVDQPGPLTLPDCEFVLDRGPFRLEADVALLQRHRIQIIVSKNSGGVGAHAKIAAARELGLPVIMVDRPAQPERLTFAEVAQVMDWLHPTLRGL